MRGGKAKAAATTRADSKLSVRKGSQKTTRRAKGEKDPNKPKRPPSAFFVFMEGFRKEFKQKHPNNKSVSVVGKAGGDKWKSMTEAEKAPYVAKAAKLKTEYQKTMTAYNKRQADGVNNEEEESEKSKSEVNDEEEEGSEEEEEEDE